MIIGPCLRFLGYLIVDTACSEQSVSILIIADLRCRGLSEARCHICGEHSVTLSPGMLGLIRSDYRRRPTGALCSTDKRSFFIL